MESAEKWRKKKQESGEMEGVQSKTEVLHVGSNTAMTEATTTAGGINEVHEKHC